MNLHNLKPAEGATKSRKRIGRGQGSGKGGTSTKGHKGAQSRSGYSRKLGFEGGQMPLYRLVPKRGFKNINRVEYNAINLSTLQILSDKLNLKEVTPEVLIANGLAKKKDLIKILGKGELTNKLQVTAHAFSQSAKEAIEKTGGNTVVIETKKSSVEEVAKPKAEKPKAEKLKAEEPKAEEPKAEKLKAEEPKVEEPKAEAKEEEKKEENPEA